MSHPLTLKRSVVQAGLLWLSIGFASAALAQSTTVGSISGTIRDPNGAVVPKAEVVLREERTGFSRTVTADESGFYTAPSLPAGIYTVTSAPQGFKTMVLTGVDLHVSESRVVNVFVEVGPVRETVTVTLDAAQIDTRTGEVSSLVSAKQIAELPLNGRNYAALAFMVPGVSPPPGPSGTRGTGLDSFVVMSVNGNQSNANLWTVDGVNNMDVGSNNTLLVFPSIDSIAEFRVERNSFGAEFGQAQGAVVNLITKGGTNEFHGTAFEFFRNDALNATDFFLNRAGQPQGKLRYNDFGFTVSGPIVKDRAFFFWSEEWRHERRGVTLSAKVPTAAEKVGDFSGALTGPLPHIPGSGRDVDGQMVYDYYPGNRIPTGLLSSAGLALLKIYPDPNTSGIKNWTSSPLEPIDTHQDLLRVDVAVTDRSNVMVRWIRESWTHGSASGNYGGDSPFPTLSSDWATPSRSLAVRLTNQLGATAINEFQFSRAGNDIFVTTSSPAGQALNDEIASKFPTVFPRPAGFGLPTVWMDGGYETLWHQAPWQNHEDLLIWKDDFSKVMGSHDLKFGGLVSHNIKNEPASGPNTVYSADGTKNHTGNAIADLLVTDLPLASYTELDHAENTLARWHDFEVYGRDTWKVHPRLTLTLGLRWSRYSPIYSANDRISNYVPRLYDGKNPLSGLVQAGTRGFNRSLVQPDNMGFQPRLGLAWDILGDGKTALRLGFGRYIGRAQALPDVLGMANNPPWTTTVATGPGGDFSNSLGDDPTFRSLDTINLGLKDAVAGVGPDTPFHAVSENFRQPESWQWNLTLSREVMKDTMVEASYIGNHGLHIWRPGIRFNDVVPSARLAVARAIRNGEDTSDLINANRRLPGLGPIFLSESTGDSNYHALQVWVNRRFSDRLTFQVAYTWSHAITNALVGQYSDGGTTDPFNYDLDRGDSDLDRRHMIVANAVYVLPSFRGWGEVANGVLGDWQVNAIVSRLSGRPINIVSRANTAGFADDEFPEQSPDLVPGIPIYLHTADPTEYLNPAAFSLPGVGQFGNLGRGVVRIPANFDLDISFVKNVRVGDRFDIQLRTEIFNVLNHPNFWGVDKFLDFEGRSAEPNFGKPTNPNFGSLLYTRGSREIQFGLKFSF